MCVVCVCMSVCLSVFLSVSVSSCGVLRLRSKWGEGWVIGQVVMCHPSRHGKVDKENNPKDPIT